MATFVISVESYLGYVPLYECQSLFLTPQGHCSRSNRKTKKITRLSQIYYFFQRFQPKIIQKYMLELSCF